MAKVRTVFVLVSILALVSAIFLSCAPKYTLSVSGNPAAGGTVAPASSTYGNNVVVDEVATPASGYRFDHWEGSASGTSLTAHVTMDSNKTAVAYFTKTYTLSISCTPTSGGNVSPSSGTHDENSVVNVTATPASGYRFDHWEGSVSGASATISITMDGDKTLTAYLTKLYTLATSCTPTSGGSVSPASGTYDEGDNATLIATPAQYYEFNGWGGDASGTSDHVTITMDSNKTVVASFVKLTYTVQTQVHDGVGGTVDPGNGTFEAGTHVNITATPASGYRFDHWGGSATGTTNPLNLLVNEDKTVTAYFTKTYTLTVSVSPNGNGSIDPNGGVFDAGTVVTLTATTTLFPYAFDHWSGTDNDSTNPTSVTMNGDKSVTVYFKQLNPGTQQTMTNQISGPPGSIVTWQLTAGQWVQGEIQGWSFDVAAHIVDSNSNVVKELGRVSDAFFTFQAPSTGAYSFVIYASYSILYNHYTLTYTIYS